MAQGGVQRLKSVVTFTVRQDKTRGMLIESLAKGDDVFLFKFRDQPIDRHCKQIQQIVRLANVKRSKKINVDITEFLQEYFLGEKYDFRGTSLDSVHQQIDRTCALKTNKEISVIKRRLTYAANKQKRIEENNAKNLKKTEKKFQTQRAIQIHELFRRVNQGTVEREGSRIIGEVQS